jgi:adenine C2-methylase RlmN of 23S rRNA A2503 and tRNA A37
LNNYNEVRPAVQMMTNTRVFGMRRSAVTVSTVGVIPRILQMADDLPGVSLALSLHAPNQVAIVRSAALIHCHARNAGFELCILTCCGSLTQLDMYISQELRKSIVPSASAYKLDKLMAAIETYQQRTKQRVCMSI